MIKMEKQNAMITKLHSKYGNGDINQSRPRHFSGNDAEKKKISRSVDELPTLNKSKIQYDLIGHIPSPHIPTKMLKRY